MISASHAVTHHLPSCKLISALLEKATAQSAVTFDYAGQLERFRERVAGEVKYTALTFPEFTPHDEKHHLTRLFHFADEFLGDELIDSMNVMELFVLAVGLYGHDWGMAVNIEERSYILTKELPADRKASDFWTLNDEDRVWSKFAREHGLLPDDQQRFTDVPDDLWREYVRRTHARRSGQRVRKYFFSIDGGVAEAGQRVCEGHWLDIEQVEDQKQYPTDYPVQGRTINLRALAIYVRLIDLLDIGEDRTPYVIWKFVAPRDRISKLEWSKHRALRPVAITEKREYIVVQGSTDDHQAFAALEDLRVWCQDQFRVSNAALARMHHPTHKLLLSDIHWNVDAIGFDPILIRFEFNRDRMFDILADEIYQGDYYVFLRELLQNCIDAIRLRRELLEKKGEDAGNRGVIQVDVDHQANGDVVVSFRDDGIGMDEHIIRDYLAVAGKSYYRSEEFQRLGLTLDPISRFGIGILSCFMSAERIEIETYRDPLLSPGATPLKVIIPAFRGHFRVEQMDAHTAKVGTTVKVFVDGNRLPAPKETTNTAEKSSRFDVTSYLSQVAGFVSFPIVINEHGCRTVILHPKQDREEAFKRFGKDVTVQQLDLGYNWKKVFLPQDLDNARKVFVEQRWDVSEDLQCEGIEGVISTVVPRNDITIKEYPTSNSVGAEMQYEQEVVVRWRDQYSRDSIQRDSPSAQASDFVRCYRDGILVSGQSTLGSWDNAKGYEAPSQCCLINLTKQWGSRLNVARDVIRSNDSWQETVQSALNEKISRDHLPQILRQTGIDRMLSLALFSRFYQLDIRILSEMIPNNQWPVVVIDSAGTILFKVWEELAHKSLRTVEYPIWEARQAIADALYKRAEKISDWAMGEIVHTSSLSDDRPEDSLSNFSYVAFERTHTPIGLSVRASDQKVFSWIVWEPTGSSMELNDSEILEKAATTANQLTPREWNAVCRMIEASNYQLSILAIPFLPPFGEYFVCQNFGYNANHSVTQQLLKVHAKRLLQEQSMPLVPDISGRLDDALKNVVINRSHRLTTIMQRLIDGLPAVWEIGIHLGWMNPKEACVPQASDFMIIPGD